MRKWSLLLGLLLLGPTVYGQSMEYVVHLNAGLFSFAGTSVTQSSFIIVNNLPAGKNYTNNPYGSDMTWSYGLAFQAQYLTRRKTILGLQTGFESLRSRVDIVEVASDYNNSMISAHGHSILTNQFIILYPNIGHRFFLNQWSVDLLLGPEIGFNLGNHEKGKATITQNDIVTTNLDRINSGTDYRLRLSVNILYRHWGLSTGYSYGLRNYTRNMLGANPERYARFIRFGIIYKIP